MKNSVTRAWKVWSSIYELVKEEKDLHYDWSNAECGTRTVDIQPSEENGFVVVSITRNTAQECERELEGQLSDGLFENYGGYAEEELTEAENG